MLKTVGVCIDIDGVIKLGRNRVPGAAESILKLRKLNIPYLLLTNGGGESEENKANKLSKFFNINFKKEEIVLSHTPMQSSLQKYKNGLMLLSGYGNIHSVMEAYNFRNYVTVDEYKILFPEVFPYFLELKHNEKIYNQTKSLIENRIQQKIKQYPQFQAIVQLTDLTEWEVHLQIFADVIMSPKGVPGLLLKKNERQKVDYHIAAMDLLFKDQYHIPRFACGAFYYCLENLIKMKYNRQIKCYSYGKPSSIIFDYARKVLINQNKNRHFTKFYMIGDNPEVDIKGANENNFHSILVRTGIFKGENSKEYPAKTVVDDISKGVNYIEKEVNKLI